MRNQLLLYLFTLAVCLSAIGVTYASFGDKGEITGSTFSVGSADIKLLKDLSGGLTSENLVEEMQGPSFTNISPNWIDDYALKIYNNASTQVTLTTNASYETANDPAELRQVIYVEPFIWNDANSDGIVENHELTESFGRKTIIKWKSEGFNLGTLPSGEVKGFVLRFTAPTLSDTKQGASAIFDFEFNSLGL